MYEKDRKNEEKIAWYVLYCASHRAEYQILTCPAHGIRVRRSRCLLLSKNGMLMLPTRLPRRLTLLIPSIPRSPITTYLFLYSVARSPTSATRLPCGRTFNASLVQFLAFCCLTRLHAISPMGLAYLIGATSMPYMSSFLVTRVTTV